MSMFMSTGLESVPADHLKWTLVILMGLAIFLMQVWDRVKPTKPTVITPDPLRVEKLDKFATRDFCEAQHEEMSRRLDGHDEDIRRIYDEIKAERAANQVHQSERSKTLFVEIKAVRDELTEKIDGMPDRIIRLLNELNLLNRPGNPNKPNDTTRTRGL